MGAEELDCDIPNMPINCRLIARSSCCSSSTLEWTWSIAALCEKCFNGGSISRTDSNLKCLQLPLIHKSWKPFVRSVKLENWSNVLRGLFFRSAPTGSCSRPQTICSLFPEVKTEPLSPALPRFFQRYRENSAFCCATSSCVLHHEKSLFWNLWTPQC